MEENIAPTKSNLMEAQYALEFCKRGYELLDKKRNVLIREMMGLMDKAQDIQKKVRILFKEAYEALQVANITIGVVDVYEVAKSIPKTADFSILTRSIMGVEIPVIKYKEEELQHYYSFYHTNTALDVAVQKFYEVKNLLYQLAEVEDSVFKLAMEIKRTQKRANALKNIQIPKYTAIVKMITEVLEEKDREDFFRLKVLKRKLAQKAR
ncbi:V/A-type H+-transporting ATPase subunit D [Caldanaerobius fijiensis DSM 17918]|uniref:V-type ATP synthase subunit D n=1 Tax=Caldanaerobius fijiensis DSM 17918 TaxID=1121256 RepID=A0A1M4WAG9_9THEO|nr:V-type ATP synthase subunit D [Caldanaerobius fijiensis]SHE78216.1 V/A-type H+-transporting ATPase subunit D [Caldanaerobius fijiensis DSM 17918]